MIHESRLVTWILCAAIWYDDGKEHPHQPTKTGLVYCGRRHCCIFPQMTHLPKQDPTTGKYRIQGFLTSDNRFVERKEAAVIAFEAGQIKEKKDILFSEDLY